MSLVLIGSISDDLVTQRLKAAFLVDYISHTELLEFDRQTRLSETARYYRLFAFRASCARISNAIYTSGSFVDIASQI